MNDLEKVHIVAVGMTKLLEDAIRKECAIRALMDTMMFMRGDCGEGSWYSIVLSSLLDSLVLDVSALLDRAKYKTDTNCCFRELIAVLESNKISKPMYQNNINDIEALLDTYDDVVSKKMRNKKLAHKDLNTLFDYHGFMIDCIQIEQFLVKGYKVVSNVMEMAIGARLIVPDLDAIENRYELLNLGDDAVIRVAHSENLAFVIWREKHLSVLLLDCIFWRSLKGDCSERTTEVLLSTL